MTITLPTTDARAVAREVLGRLEAAWNAGDGQAFGRVYTTDASFVTVRGEHIVGRPAISDGHGVIFRTIYAGSVNAMEPLRADEVAPGVVLAVSLNTLTCPAGPFVGVHQAMSTSLLTRIGDDAGWSVAATANTLVGV